MDLNQKCYGVRIYSGAEWVIFCVFMKRKFRENKNNANSASLRMIMVLSASLRNQNGTVIKPPVNSDQISSFDSFIDAVRHNQR